MNLPDVSGWTSLPTEALEKILLRLPALLDRVHQQLGLLEELRTGAMRELLRRQGGPSRIQARCFDGYHNPRTGSCVLPKGHPGKHLYKDDYATYVKLASG